MLSTSVMCQDSNIRVVLSILKSENLLCEKYASIGRVHEIYSFFLCTPNDFNSDHNIFKKLLIFIIWR